MSTRKYYLPLFAILVIALTIGLSGCDMGSSETEAVVREADLIATAPETVDHVDILGLQEYNITVSLEGIEQGTFKLENAVLPGNGESNVTIKGKSSFNIVTDHSTSSFVLAGEGTSLRVDLAPLASSSAVFTLESEDISGFFVNVYGDWNFHSLKDLDAKPWYQRYVFLRDTLDANQNSFVLYNGHYAKWADYENIESLAEGDLFADQNIVSFLNVTQGVWMEVTEEGLKELDKAPAIKMTEVRNEAEFIEALNKKAPGIKLLNDIVLTNRTRIRYNLRVLDLNNKTIRMTDGPIVFEGNGTLIKNGTLRGLMDYSGDHDRDNVVLISGEAVKFSKVNFRVLVLDWYQDQGNPAKKLVIEHSHFRGQSVFAGGVTINDSYVYNRMGLEHNGAVLNRVTFDKDSVYGILYVASHATLNDITWAHNFTGMYVGKSLKYKGQYVPAEPILKNATINTTKEGNVWWAINHDKAILTVKGVVNIVDRHDTHGLTLVGSYGDYDGGHIYGDAIFKGAPVHFGWNTRDFTLGDTGKYAKYPDIPKEVDKQAREKNADKLTIHGPTFQSDVYIFTPVNDYIPGWRVPLDETVWLGNVKFGKVFLWGDFTVIDKKTVTFEKMIVSCGNIRGVFAETTGTSILHHPPDHTYPTFVQKGTLKGGKIYSDTKGGVLVLGDNLLVENVVVEPEVYNVILETTKLKNVTLNVGHNIYTNNRVVQGYPLNYDVHVWDGKHAIFEDVTWSAATRIEVLGNPKFKHSGAKLTFAGNVRNHGLVKFQTYASIGFDSGRNPVFTNRDPRNFATIAIRNEADMAYIDVSFVSFEKFWKFNNWKSDILLSFSHEASSSKFELRDDKGNFFIWDYRSADPEEMLNNWISETIGTRDLQARSGKSVSYRIRAESDKKFTITAIKWARNSCSLEQIRFADASRVVTLEGKTIQVSDFIVVDLSTRSTVRKNRSYSVEAVIKNTGTAAGSELIYLLVNGVQASMAGPINLTPNQEATIVLHYTSPNSLGSFELRLETPNKTLATRTVTVTN